jgi:uracil phosphoribosyltransferase
MSVHIFDHPLIHHKVAKLRDARTDCATFRTLVEELAMLMAYEVTDDLPTETVQVQTPLAVANCQVVDEENIIIVPILRAGLGMVSGFQKLLPRARVGHIGMSRNEDTHEPEAYYYKMPKGLDQATVIVVDPMLATGGSACDAIRFLKDSGARRLKFVGLIAAQQGLDRLSAAHPDVDIYIAEKDEVLNENAYIVPGLGDAGDRIFGTL